MKTFSFRQHLLMYVEQLFRCSFKKHVATFGRAKYYRYEIVDLSSGVSGLRSRLHEAELMNLYLRKYSEFKSFLELCDEAIEVIEIMQQETITPRDLSRINLIHAIKEAVKTKSKNFRCVFQKNLFSSLSKKCNLNLLNVT